MTEHQGDLGLAIKLDDRGFLHFVVQIVTLTSSLTDTGEDGVTTMGFGNVVLNLVSPRSLCSSMTTHNQLLDKHGLADTGTTEETNLSTTSIRSQKIDDLDTGDENFSAGGLFDERRSIGVDGSELVTLDGSSLVNGIASDVHDTAQGAVSDRNHNGVASIRDFATSDETLGTCI